MSGIPTWEEAQDMTAEPATFHTSFRGLFCLPCPSSALLHFFHRLPLTSKGSLPASSETYPRGSSDMSS